MRNLKRVSIILLVVSIFLVFSGFANKDKSDLKKELVFNGSVELELLKEEIKKADINVVEFKNNEFINGSEYTGGYLVNPNLSLDESIADYNKQYYYGLMEGIRELTKSIQLSDDDSYIKSAKILLNDLEQRLKNYEKNRKIKITKVVLYDKSEKIDKFIKQNKIKNNISKIDSISE